MARAEGERGLDLERDLVVARAATIVRAMHEKASGAHRRQALQGALDPVLLGDASKGGLCRQFVSADTGDEVTDIVLVRCLTEIDLDHPRADVPVARVGFQFESGGGGLGGIERFDDEIGDLARNLLLGDEAHDMGGVIGGQTFKHRRVTITLARACHAGLC